MHVNNKCVLKAERESSVPGITRRLEKRRNPPEKTVVRKPEDRKLSELGERRTNEKFPHIPARYGNAKRSSCTHTQHLPLSSHLLFFAKRYFLFME